jgi:hypothetical protein
MQRLKEKGVVPVDMDNEGYLAWVSEKSAIGAKQVMPERDTEKLTRNEVSNGANRRKRYRKIYNKVRKAGTTDLNFDEWFNEREKRRLMELEKGTVNGKDIDGDTTMDPTDDIPVEESSKERHIPGRPSVNISAARRMLHHDLAITKSQAVEKENMRKEWVATHKGDTANKRKGFAREQFGKKPKKIIYDGDGNPISASIDTEEIVQEEEDPDAWRQKLALTAVECEWDNVVLPEPSYPFKQPRFPLGDVVAGQKRKRGGGKKKKQQQDEYGARNGYGQSDGYYQQQQDYDDWNNHDYYDDTTYPAAKDTTMEDPVLVDDLPPLPADLSTLHPLSKPVLPGTVLAFKQFTMDKNYTPIIADYKTAIVEEVIDEPDGPLLVMRLAIRDRMEREVDKTTGEKVLRKFEMPGDTRSDEGKEELMWGELMQPLLVKLPEGAKANSNDEKVNGNDANGNGDNASLDRADGAADGDDNGTEEAMDDAPNAEPDEAERGGEEPTSGQGNVQNDEEPTSGQATYETATEAAGKTSPTLSERIAATLEAEEEEALLEELAADMAVVTDEHAASQEEAVDTQLPDAQVTNSPKYSYSFRELNTPEPEAQVVDTTAVAPDTPPSLEAHSAQQSVYDSDDSDCLPSLEHMLSHSQRASVKVEASTQDEPQLLPLPVFSPFGMKTSSREEKSLDEQQIQHEVEGAKGVSNGPKKITIKSGVTQSQVQVIDLTATSSDAEEIQRKKRNRRGKKKTGNDAWRAVRS